MTLNHKGKYWVVTKVCSIFVRTHDFISHATEMYDMYTYSEMSNSCGMQILNVFIWFSLTSRKEKNVVQTEKPLYAIYVDGAVLRDSGVKILTCKSNKVLTDLQSSMMTNSKCWLRII